MFRQLSPAAATARARTDHQNHYELQNYTSVIHGNHTIKFGARLRAMHDANYSTAGFNGTFILSLDEFQYAQCGTLNPSAAHRASGLPPANPDQLVITRACPHAKFQTYDAGLYVQDDWRVRPNITLSLWLRFETQNDIHDHDDWRRGWDSPGEWAAEAVRLKL